MSSHNPITAAAVSGAGETLSLGNVDGVVTYQSFAGAAHIIPPQKMHNGPIRCLRFSADGRFLASGSDDKLAIVMDTTSGTGRQLQGHGGPVKTIDVSDRGDIATGSGDHTVRIWTMDDSKPLKTLAHSMGVNHVSFTPRGHMLATAGPGGVIIFDGNDYKDMPVIDDASVKLVRFSRDGSRMATVTTGNVVRVWDTTRALDLVKLPLLAERIEGGRVSDVAFNFKGDRLGICREDGVLTVWFHATGNILQPQIGDGTVPLKIWSMDFDAADGFLPVYSGRIM